MQDKRVDWLCHLASSNYGAGTDDNPLRRLSRNLVDHILGEQEKVQLQLYMLAKGECASPEEIWSFSKLEPCKVTSAIEVVTDWMNEGDHGEIFSQAVISGKFTEEDKKNIAAVAWKKYTC